LRRLRDLLEEAFYEIKRNAAPGTGLTWQRYEADLDRNLEDLHARLHRGAYRALPWWLAFCLAWLWLTLQRPLPEPVAMAAEFPRDQISRRQNEEGRAALQT